MALEYRARVGIPIRIGDSFPFACAYSAASAQAFSDVTTAVLFLEKNCLEFIVTIDHDSRGRNVVEIVGVARVPHGDRLIGAPKAFCRPNHLT